MDFVPLKQALREIADEFDHRVLIPGNCKHMELSLGQEIVIKAQGKRYVFPPEDVVILDAEESSAEELAQIILQMVLEKIPMPANVKDIEIGVDEELGQSAWATKKLR
jgi:6-pyruvoyltetrahydropterin/6-carboxytetrahydropterin synthase